MTYQLKKKNDTLLSLSLIFLSESALKENKYKKAEQYALEGIKLIDTIKYKKSFLKNINQLGRVHDYFQEYKKAIKVYKRAFKTNSKEAFFDSELSIIYQNLGTAYSRLNQNEEAIKYYIRGTEIAKKYKNYDHLSYSMYTVGWLYMQLEQYEKAENYFMEGLKDSSKINSKSYIYMNHHGIGLNYSRWGKLDKAILHNKIALKFYSKSGKKLYAYDLMNNMAAVYNRKQEYETAKNYAQKALKIANSINHKAAINGAKQNLLSSYISTRNYNKAEILLNEIAKDTNDTKLISKPFKAVIYQNFSSIYKAKGLFKKSLENFIKYNAVNDSILREQRDSNIAELQTKYETEKKEKENLQLKADNSKQELLTQKANMRNWLLTFGLLAVCISAFFIWKRYQSEVKAKQIISKQKDEIEQQKNIVETLQKELHHRLKNNLSFIDLFINLAKGQFTNQSYQIKLNELQNRMRSMFEVHKQLFNKDDVTSVNAKNYIDTLVENVKKAYAKNNIIITNNTGNNEIILANTSFPIGLIINEFVTNSYKYAFNDDQNGLIDISLTSNEKQYNLSLKDNGKGLPKDFNIDELNSFGLETMQLLTKEYGGTFFINGSHGVTLTISLPKTAA